MSTFINQIIQETRRNGGQPSEKRQDLIKKAMKAGVETSLIQFAIGINTPDESTGQTFSDQLGKGLRGLG